MSNTVLARSRCETSLGLIKSNQLIITMALTSRTHHYRTSSLPQRRHFLGMKKRKVDGEPKSLRINGRFPCVYRNAKGTLFATSDGLSFTGKCLFFQKSIHIKWRDILEIVDNSKNIGSATSISLITTDGKQSRHDFTKVQKPKEVQESLVSMHKDSYCRPSDTSTASSSDISILSEEENAELKDEWNTLQQDESYSKHAIQVREKQYCNNYHVDGSHLIW